MNTVLIADDNAAVRRMLLHCLGGEDRTMIMAEDGESALELARRHLPDLVILDGLMPGRGGLEVCAALRADDRTRRIPVMLLTGMGEPAEGALGVDGGPDDYVSKPFKLLDLDARVRALLGRPS